MKTEAVCVYSLENRLEFSNNRGVSYIKTSANRLKLNGPIDFLRDGLIIWPR